MRWLYWIGLFVSLCKEEAKDVEWNANGRPNDKLPERYN